MKFNQTLRILSDPIKLEEFQNLYHVDAHKLSHEEKTQDVLDRRDRTNYLNSPFKCDMCFKGFMAEDFFVEAKKHFIEFHQRKLSTTCEYCGLEFCSTPKYLQHVNDVHPNELIWCNMCGHLFIREVSLEKHKKRRHRNLHLSSSCPHCEVQLVDGAALDSHLFPGICSRYTCVHCGAGHSNAMRLRNHILKAHNKRNCNKVYKQGAHLQNHLKYVHYKVNRKVVCEICGVVVATNASLKVHMRHHTGERPYQCPVCMKGFMSQTSMMRHRNTVHTTLRPFACERCPKAFKKKDSLLSHEQKVHDIRMAPPGELPSLGVLI
ncbi:hypothetical protein HW555_012467 [Spodoptera exigua]|uniref:C2H2-type domain-containing protein n=1 Tax=Spodoptera exigua TaxID=7107 RepID=A0A835KXW4_SPOEX|nr:hypothetical protein HW555_012467 [Spodoptera exigua]